MCHGRGRRAVVMLARAACAAAPSAWPRLCRLYASAPTTISSLPLSRTVSALPIVYHPSYSAPAPLLGPHHRFPMAVFQRIHDRLLHHHRLIDHSQLHCPIALPSEEQLLLVHDEAYLNAFSAGLLDAAATRRIGFGAATASPVLIERTKAEVAGTLLTARLALEHGLACNTAGGEREGSRVGGRGDRAGTGARAKGYPVTSREASEAPGEIWREGSGSESEIGIRIGTQAATCNTRWDVSEARSSQQDQRELG